MKPFVAGDHELTLTRTSAFGADTIDKIPGINRQPVCFGILLPVDKGSPPGYSTFFVLSATGGYIAPDIAAVHDLQFTVSRSTTATLQQESGHPCHTNQGCQ